MSVIEARHGRVTILTINRPEKLNALNYAAIDELMRLLTAIESDDEVRAIVLTGQGERAFSAGADVEDLAVSLAKGVETAVREVVVRGQGLTRRIESFPKPFIAAVNGLAYGGGCEVTEAAHLAIASEQAMFAKPEIKLGFPPPFGGSQRLPRHIGRKRALEMILTGAAIDAERAEAIGLVNQVVPHARLLDEAQALAERIICYPPSAVTACLAAVTRGINLPIDEALAVEANWFAITAPSEGVANGIQMFRTRLRSAT
ncbi:crotonase/enoyl-CoA hydratase family protein [Brevundimonas sp. TWP2-3-4b1]|uniref:crotonase/enoyl-CoA hydratase family protein n=1 Tax=Brevundimonas sp. TWP2-3-4b1 TaxID=2804580 RepID=UPI003CEC29D2